MTHMPRDRWEKALLACFGSLAPDTGVTVCGDASPGRVLRSLQASYPNTLEWWPLEWTPGRWRVCMARRDADPVVPRTITDLMVSDHLRLDRMYGRIYRLLEAGDLQAARCKLGEFATGLRRHIVVEEGFLMPLMVSQGRPSAQAESTKLAEEHERIQNELRQAIAAVDDRNSNAAADACAALTRMRFLLEGHNRNEEQVLYPQCEQAVNPDERAEFIRRIQALEEERATTG